MRELIAKKARRKCCVRGCRNIADVYALSRTNECGNSIILCLECARGAEAAITAAMKQLEKDGKKKAAGKTPPLFFADILCENQEVSGENQEASGEKREAARFVCAVCGRGCVNKAGLIAHTRKCAAGD